MPDNAKNYTIEVYMDDGRVFYYTVTSEEKAREHISAIVTTGWRRQQDNTFEHYPVHRILKCKCIGLKNTNYPCEVRGT